MSKIEFAEELKKRTKKFAIDIINLCKTLPRNNESFIISKQLIRSATSVAANYRAVCRARSDAEFYAKLCIVVEEADECVLWIEMIIETELSTNEKAKILLKESNEILAIMASSKKTTRISNTSRNQQFSN